jgi:hypothetical protein
MILGKMGIIGVVVVEKLKIEVDRSKSGQWKIGVAGTGGGRKVGRPT